VIHGFGHIVQQLVEAAVKHRDGAAFFPEGRVFAGDNIS